MICFGTASNPIRQNPFGCVPIMASNLLAKSSRTCYYGYELVCKPR